MASRARPACTDDQEDDQTERERLETSLLGSEQLFWTTYERAVIGIAHVGPEKRWLRFNQRLCDLLGYSREELAAHTFLDITHPDDREASSAYFQRLLAGETDAYELDKRYIRKDGAPVWVHLTVSLVRTPEGAPDYTISIVQDITERKRLEQERAHLLKQERAATHAVVAETNAQLRAMQALTDTALSHLALDDLLPELLGRVTAVMGVDTVAISLLDEDSQTVTVRAMRGLGEEDAGRVHVPVGQGFLSRIVASREPLIVDADALSAADFEGVHPTLRERLRSVAGVPLLVEDQVEGRRAEGRLVGVLAVGSTTSRRFTAADVQLLQRAADRIAMAVDRARLYAAEQDARQRAEAALARVQASEAQASERAERLRTILETMADGVAVYDAEGRPVQMVNRAYRELYAVERAPAGYETLPTFDRARLLHLRDAATGEPLPFEDTPAGRALRGETVMGPSADIRVQAFDGRELEVNSSAAPLHDGDGHVTGTVLVLRDMTERNRLAREREAARVQAERQADQLDRIFEAAADGLMVYDAEGRMVRANAAAHRILGWDAAPPGFSQLPLPERLDPYAARDEQGRPIPPDEWPFVRALRGEVGPGTGAETRDIRMRALDGREIELTYSTAPLRDREGHVVGVVNVLHDQTERKRLEREREAALARAQASEARAAERAEHLHTILETMADGVSVFDQNGRLIQMNRAGRELLDVDRAPGFDALSFADQNCPFDTRDAATGAPVPPEQHLVARTLRGEVVSGPDADFLVRAFDGRELEVNASAAPLHDGDGRIVGAVLVAHDITWRRRLEREREAARADELAAREASRRMEEFLAVAAHDLRTPLTATLGYIALAQRRFQGLAAAAREGRPDLASRMEDARVRLEEAGRGGERLARLLTLLFDTAAVRADRLELHRAPCDLVALVREQVEALRVAAPGRTIRLHARAGSEPIPVEVDADRIGQVVTNYVTNALKYAPPDRPIDVSVGAHGGRVHVAVCDQGPGISKEERARVWELFHRAGVAPQSGAQGQALQGSLGLGLYICKAIIRAHGGRVGVKSAVGRGSTFWFTLPLAGLESSNPESSLAGAAS